MYPKNQSLRKTIGGDLFKQVVQRAKQLGLGVNIVNQLKPWPIACSLI